MAVSPEQVEKEAKAIMDSFLKALEKIEVPEDQFAFVERDQFVRDQKLVMGDDEFRKLMFENAPKKREGYILTEKGAWV